MVEIILTVLSIDVGHGSKRIQTETADTCPIEDTGFLASIHLLVVLPWPTV